MRMTCKNCGEVAHDKKACPKPLVGEKRSQSSSNATARRSDQTNNRKAPQQSTQAQSHKGKDKFGSSTRARSYNAPRKIGGDSSMLSKPTSNKRKANGDPLGTQGSVAPVKMNAPRSNNSPRKTKPANK
ncbi:hypothetical protein PVK06_017211 [Gossypium arboreum]|uniref:CCHC-type domain-containing protein n=1 Tax=Gossypium arboreum TaxID=29729 RepID=A0ABR0Q2J4_GOSAR|nr:hypothetical protein PVK06_017211 [Gossypium arboreum]